MKRFRWVWGIGGLLAVFVIGFLIWAFNPAQPDQIALAALNSDSFVEIKQLSNGIYFLPRERQNQTGLIFYPGGRVDYRAYAPLMRQIAAQGYPVYLVKMPLSLAVFDPDRAEDFLDNNPEIQSWVLGGHSLGGAMAANYVYRHPGDIKGLLLWAAYPAENNDLSTYDLQVTSISASLDGLATPEKISNSFLRLPGETQFFEIKGGNHAQFGNYGVQKGDLTAQIEPLIQQEWILKYSLELLSAFD